jgi:hypothetical protein
MIRPSRLGKTRHGTRVEDAVYGKFIDPQCFYANRWILFIPLHGVNLAHRPFGGRRNPEQECEGAKFAMKPPFDSNHAPWSCAVVNIWATYGVISMGRTNYWTRRSNIRPPSGDILRNCQK